MYVLMSVTLKILIYALAVSKADLDQWGMITGCVDVLLGFWRGTELALRWRHTR
jgi:hypothetical protein